jgi:uncharacterized protein YqeY
MNIYPVFSKKTWRSVMEILEKIEADLKDALKSGDTIAADTLRMIKSDLSYEKAKKGEDINEEKVMEIIARAAKRRKESIEEYKKGNREDLAEKEAAELKVVEKYLPEQMGEDEVEKIVENALATMGEVSKKDFGRIMGQLMKELKGKVDGSVVKSVLSGKLGD